METLEQFVDRYGYSESFNFLASLINGNVMLSTESNVAETVTSFNFLASLINGNSGVPLSTSGEAFNFLASLINGNGPGSIPSPIHFVCF